ncbi:MAG TPA: hypothetical protein VGR85_15580 [Candidatus Limnocylindria bacterium]|jgi:hypothetical protein|nr:hypothetical protein [Candidatus Limnocylindria bacterium]
MRVAGARGFDIDLSVGEQIEDEVLRTLLGRSHLEVKYQPDARVALFIETSYRGRQSGLSTTEAEWWCLVYAQGRQMQLVRTDILEAICRDRGKRSRGGDDNASEGWVVRISDLALPFP